MIRIFIFIMVIISIIAQIRGYDNVINNNFIVCLIFLVWMHLDNKKR